MAGKRFCPQCGSENVELASGGTTGFWICNECDYSGGIFPEHTAGDDEFNDKSDEEEIIEKLKGKRKAKPTKIKKQNKKGKKK